MKKILGILAVVSIFSLAGCESLDRASKTFDSNLNGGLNRKMEVYSMDGKLLRTYEGKFDIQSNEDKNGGTTGTKVLFDLNGKRHIIYNATVIVDEK